MFTRLIKLTRVREWIAVEQVYSCSVFAPWTFIFLNLRFLILIFRVQRVPIKAEGGAGLFCSFGYRLKIMVYAILHSGLTCLPTDGLGPMK